MTKPADTPTMVDYEAERCNFHLNVPDDFNWAYDVTDGWAADPHHLAMLWVRAQGAERRLTFTDFQHRSNWVADALAQLYGGSYGVDSLTIPASFRPLQRSDNR